MRIGSGFDVHAFGPGDHVMLGGVRMPHAQGVVAHSDGDVVLHALADALLGAVGAGDIGQLFPDSDPAWRGAASRMLLRRVMQEITGRGYRVVNCDVTVLAQAPRLAPHRDTMRANIAADLGVRIEDVSVKATTTERLGFVGRAEGIAAQAVVLLAPAEPTPA
ncbi:MAG: 2-C-methyl-D-erythritol 2,4-cyclodiphosphate synthase [Proteobacteria bacterium]|nr:2-C-methyl-D-erythritol 2,4-cyclodiphosphate synthase [Pseudomonadota bacterium]